MVTKSIKQHLLELMLTSNYFEIIPREFFGINPLKLQPRYSNILKVMVYR